LYICSFGSRMSDLFLVRVRVRVRVRVQQDERLVPEDR